jgi:hypothetical protein
MQTLPKLMLLELVSGLFGWGWILASLASLYFLVAALAFNGRWSSFLWAVGFSIVAKWLARGFNDNKNRVGYEADLVSRGFSKPEAGGAWLQAYSGGRDKLAELVQRDHAEAMKPSNAMQKLVNDYGVVLQRCGGHIVSEELLPAPKQEIKNTLIAVALGIKSTGNISPETMEHLRGGYAFLADFVSQEEAEIMSCFDGLVQAGSDIKDPSDPRLLEIAQGLNDKRAFEIQQRSQDEFIRLIQEFNAAVTL